MASSLLLEVQNLQLRWQIARVIAALMAGGMTAPALGPIELAYGPVSC